MQVMLNAKNYRNTQCRYDYYASFFGHVLHGIPNTLKLKGLRHSNGQGYLGPQGCQNDNVLYSCLEPGSIRVEKPCGWALGMSILCRSVSTSSVREMISFGRNLIAACKRSTRPTKVYTPTVNLGNRTPRAHNEGMNWTARPRDLTKSFRAKRSPGPVSRRQLCLMMG